MMTGEQETVILKTEHGTIEGTADHALFVFGKGLTAMSNIEYNDHICKYHGIENNDLTLMGEERKFGWMAWFITAIQMLQIRRADGHGSSILQTQQLKRGTMLNFGKNIIKKKSQMAWKFITLPVILSITLLKILFLSTIEIMRVSTGKRRAFGRTFVSIAIKNSFQKFSENGDPPYSAPLFAGQDLTTEKKEDLKKENAPSVAKQNWSKNPTRPYIVPVRVLSVQHGKNGKQKVYNLRTESGMYCVNGYLTTNCDHAMDSLRYYMLSHTKPLEIERPERKPGTLGYMKDQWKKKTSAHALSGAAY
jgi:hypothetical protein